jgi:hypothetical protein
VPRSAGCALVLSSYFRTTTTSTATNGELPLLTGWSFIRRFFAYTLAACAIVLMGIWALTGRDSMWLLYALFFPVIWFAGAILVLSCRPVRNSSVGFAVGASSMIGLWALEVVDSTPALPALAAWGWVCAWAAVQGRRRVAQLRAEGVFARAVAARERPAPAFDAATPQQLQQPHGLATERLRGRSSSQRHRPR